MYRVYIYEDMDHFTDEDLTKALGIVSHDRRCKALSYISAADRKQSVIAELLLRHAISDYCSLTAMPDIIYGIQGKPAFSGEMVPEFNLSHCSQAVAVAVGDEPIGIDVEPYSSYGYELAQEVFNDEELHRTNGNPATFAELWTKKESFLKYTGQGLTDSLKTLLSNRGGAEFRTFHGQRGYACTVCSRSVNQEMPAVVGKNKLFNG